jgi:hypothetical protein
MAPPMIPAASPAPKPRCAWAGDATAEIANVATAASVNKVFLMASPFSGDSGWRNPSQRKFHISLE